MSFPPGTEMFHFPGLAFLSYVFRQEYLHDEAENHNRLVETNRL